MTTKNEKPLRLVHLAGSNFMKLRAFDLTFDEDDNLVIIGGENAQGKTAMILLIKAIFGGASELPDKPIREGSSKSTFEATLSNGIHVKRNITSKGDYLTVRDESGDAVTSPQRLLDKLWGGLAIDPVAFSRAKASDQKEMLRKLLGLDFSEMDARRATLFEDRKSTKKTLTEVQARCTPMHLDVPVVEVDVAAAVAELGRINDAATVKVQLQRVMRGSAANVTEAGTLLDECKLDCAADIADAEAAIESAQAELVAVKASSEQEVAEATVKLHDKSVIAEQAVAAYEAAPILNHERTEVLNELIKTSSTTNAMVRENLANAERSKVAKSHEAFIRSVNVEIDDLDDLRVRILGDAKFPIEGLAFDTDGVLYDGVPFSQASSAEQLRVSVAMAIAMNPTLRIILIQDGSLLDRAGTQMISDMAEAADMMVVMERVGKNAECSIVIDGGNVYLADDLDVDPTTGDYVTPAVDAVDDTTQG